MRSLSLAVTTLPLVPGTEQPAAQAAGETMLAHRLNDAIEQVFRLALARNEIQTAEDLLSVMERRRGRERGKIGHERRYGDPLGLAKRELQARKAKLSRRCRPADSIPHALEQDRC